MEHMDFSRNQGHASMLLYGLLHLAGVKEAAGIGWFEGSLGILLQILGRESTSRYKVYSFCLMR